MLEFQEIIERIYKPFPLEAKMGYRNSAVFGGFASYVINWSKSAMSAPGVGARAGRLQALSNLFSEYESASLSQRRRILEEARQILRGLSDGAASTEVSESPAADAVYLSPVRQNIECSKDAIVKDVRERFVPPPDSPVQYARGVGPQVAKKLNRLGIKTIEDLLLHFPKRHEDRSRIKNIAYVQDGAFETVYGTVGDAEEVRRKGLTIVRLRLYDDTGSINLVWFNQPYMKTRFKSGTGLIASGKVERRFREIQMMSPECEPLDEDTLNTGRIVPIYPSTENLSQRYLRKIIRGNLAVYARRLEDVLPPRILERNKLMNLPEAIQEIHFPSSFPELGRARTRLIFEDLFLLQLGILLVRKEREVLEKPRAYRISPDMLDSFQNELPFRLTVAQRRVIEEIAADLAGRKVMSRLIQGDVGSGKTVVAAFAILCAVQNGIQGAVMAPTEILAEQHYRKFLELLAPLGINVGLLTGSLGKKEKHKVNCQIASGELQVALGTQALIQEGVNFHNLGLVVVDEQHKFGVMQRYQLKEKGSAPDLLVMTATPIPRTLALTLYGDLDVSVIDELPPGRQVIKSHLATRDQSRRVFEFVRRMVAEGRQAYVVCPLIEESDRLDLKSAEAEALRLKNEVFPDLNVGLLHGRMKAQEKDEIMRAFRDGDLQILISTTVIEVGVDIPNATVMIVQDAHRFGLAQLHQLRGRVGRGAHQSYCIFIADLSSEEARQRMEAVARHHDGFAIAEEDLRLRGPGEFYGTRQHGLPDLRIANLIRDFRILEHARREAEDLLKMDPTLDRECGPSLMSRLQQRWNLSFQMIH